MKKKKLTKLTKIQQMKYIIILAEHSTLGSGVKIHEIYKKIRFKFDKNLINSR
jgi:hypothetical protein